MGQSIRLSELAGKNIVNIYDGSRLGSVQESDLLFEAETGEITEMVVPGRGGLLAGRSERGMLRIPWQSIHKIGREVIIVDLGQRPNRHHR